MLLQGKKALVLGVANEKSIAWPMAKAFKQQGANVALSYLNDQLKRRVEPLAHELGADFIFEMDVSKDAHFNSVKELVCKQWQQVDILVHSLAFARREDLKAPFSETSRAGFQEACDISAFSLIALCNTFKDIMPEDSSVMAMTYHGSSKVLVGYNVMGDGQGRIGGLHALSGL